MRSKNVLKILIRCSRFTIVFLLAFGWVYSGWPQIFNFPPEIQKANAAACSTMTVGTGTDVAASTIAPESGIADRGVFTVQGTSGTSCAKTITAMTVTLAGSGTPYLGLSEVRVTNSAGSTLYFNATSTFYSGSPNVIKLSGGTALPITLSAVTFKIRVTPKTHATMDPVPGASYTINPLVSAVTTTITPTVSDTNPNNTIIDNTSPIAATSLSITGGTAKATLGWTSTNGETSTSTILRWASSSAGGEVPTEGATYAAGDAITTATVACVFKALTTATVKSGIIDGSGGTAGCTTSALANGQAYTYTVFQQDAYGNYNAGTSFGSITTNVVVPTVTTSATVDSITATTATLNGEITVTGGANATVRGFATSTVNTLSSNVATTTDTVGQPFGVGTFTGAVTGLVCNTLYYFRAYATNSAGTGFGTIPTPFTTSACNAPPTLSISQPPSGNTTAAEGSSYNITYALADSDNVVTAAFYYDTNSSGLDGVAITGACATAAEDPTVTCSFDTSVLTPGTPYYIYGITNDGTNPQVSAYSAGTITVNDAPTLSLSEPNGTSDTVIVGASYNVTYALADSDNVVTAAFYYDTNNSGLDGVAITGACATAAESPTVTCSWDTTGMTTGSYYVYGITNDGVNSAVSAYSSGQITINPVPIYSISISPAGNIEYGYVTLSTASSTVGSTYTKTALNDSSTGTTEKISVKSSNATNGTGWTLASTIGANQFKHEFSTTTGSLWTVMPDSTTYVTAKPSVAVDGTVTFDFRLTAPSSSDYVQKSITITVLAEVP